MYKIKNNLRNMAAIVACLAVTTGFVSCETVDDGDKAKAPDAITDFIATAGNAQVGLSWDEPADDGGSAITGYEATMDNWTNKVTKTASERSHVYTGLTNGTEYTFKVRAVNVKGAGAESSAKATPKADGDGKGSYFAIKAGKVDCREYDEGYKKWFTRTIYFDDYGRKFRVESEIKYNLNPIGTNVGITDETTGKTYFFEIKEEPIPFYVKLDMPTPELLAPFSWKDKIDLLSYYKKESDRTLAGKSCSVYSLESDGKKEYVAIWNNILFWRRVEKLGQNKTEPADGEVEALIFSDAVPSADKFLPPAGYVKF